MDFQSIKDKYLNKKFITFYIIVFIVLYIFCSFIKFLGQLPILLIITFFIAYYLSNNFGNKLDSIMNKVS
jgi:hypothetical protein